MKLKHWTRDIFYRLWPPPERSCEQCTKYNSKGMIRQLQGKAEVSCVNDIVEDVSTNGVKHPFLWQRTHKALRRQQPAEGGSRMTSRANLPRLRSGRT